MAAIPLQRGFENPQAYRGGYAAIGNFDGVHRGHQRIIDALVTKSRQDGVPAVVLTFDPHPSELLRPEHAPPKLTTLEQKAQLFADRGVDCIIACPTDYELLNLTPDQFFERFAIEKLNARGFVEGPNFFFGKDRSGDVQTLKRMCDQAERSLTVVEPTEVDGRLVSSSVVRETISTGDVQTAARLLGRPYRIAGRVVRGAQRGASLGFPTANLADIRTLLPADGVYAAAARVEGRHMAAVHIGTNSTFDAAERTVEAHLIDFTGELYDAQVDVDLLDRLRDTRRFNSPAELADQIQRDTERCRQIADGTRSS